MHAFCLFGVPHFAADEYSASVLYYKPYLIQLKC